MTERSELAGDARPIGKSVPGYSMEVRQDKGMRAHVIDMTLCMNEMME